MDHALTEAGHRSPPISAAPAARIWRVAASWSKPSDEKERSSTAPPLALAIVRRGATPIPSICPRKRQRSSLVAS